MLTPNTVLQNRYQIIRQLGQGGMGTVYEARALRLNTTVAVKETHFTDERLRKQFEREAQLLAGLRHSALPRVIDHFDEEGGLYLVMDFVAGDDLAEMLKRHGGAFPVDKVLEWANQLLEALDYLHKQEPPVIHRDIKPQNLKLTPSGQIVLLDFGLAKGFAGQISRVTTSGSLFGYTPNYAPLEQIRGTGTDASSDLYSLAATLYHLITGKVPPDVLNRLTEISNGKPDPLRLASELNTKLESHIALVLHGAMSIGSSQRFKSVAEMRSALRTKLPSNAETKARALRPTIDPTDQEKRSREPLRKHLPQTVASPSPQPAPTKTLVVDNKQAVWMKLESKMRQSPLITSSVGKFKWLVGIAIAVVVLIWISAISTSYNSNSTSQNLSSPKPSFDTSSSSSLYTSQPETTAIAGQILDSQGKPVSNMFVTVSQRNGQRVTTMTDAVGGYRILGLSPGNYRMETYKLDYAHTERSVHLARNKTTTVNLSLQPSQMFSTPTP